MNASSGGTEPTSDSEPPVVGMSSVSMMSLSATGMPSSGRLGNPGWRWMSFCRASSIASALMWMNPLTAGPAASYAAMRARYMRTSSSDVMSFVCMAFNRIANGGFDEIEAGGALPLRGNRGRVEPE